MNFLIASFKTTWFGSLNEATSHWVTQRMTSIVLIPLTLIFVFTFVRSVGLTYEENLEIYKNPLRAFLMFLFISFTLLHFKQGAQVVIEDYVHDNKVNKFLLNLNVIFFWIMTFLSCIALAKIVFAQNWS